MIRGYVNDNLEAVIPLRIRLSRGRIRNINAVVDTGFTGYLTLPANQIASFKLHFLEASEYTLADGSVVVLDVYAATVIWNGEEREAFILETDGDSLAGMALLSDSRLEVEIVAGGSVRITPVK